jgi:hydroxyacylglutathione hydrolase
MLNGRPAAAEFTTEEYRVACVVNDEKWRQNSYIVMSVSTRETAVIDPGGNAEGIIQYVLEWGGVLKRILLTHAHFDHVAAASQLSAYFGIPCELHKNDVRLLKHAPMYALRFANQAIPAVTVYEVFDGQGGSSKRPAVKAIHTPGHTQGSTCYLFDEFVFTGDTIMFEHIGRTDLPGGDSTMIGESIDRLLTMLDDRIRMFPGHGRPWGVHEAKEWWNKVKDKPPHFDGSDQEAV